MQSMLEAVRRRRTPIMLTTGSLIGATLLMPNVSPAVPVIKAAQDVFVTNTDASPVPTRAVGTQSVRVENGSDRPVPVAADIQGTPTVRIAGAGAIPFAKSLRFSVRPGEGRRGGTGETFTVPQGKRLEIEFFTLARRLHDDPIRLTSVQIVTTVDGQPVVHFLGRLADEGGITEQTTIHADPGSQVSLSADYQRDEIAPYDQDFYASVSGTLTDAQTGTGGSG